jgi:hypothetical protein
MSHLGFVTERLLYPSYILATGTSARTSDEFFLLVVVTTHASISPSSLTHSHRHMGFTRFYYLYSYLSFVATLAT